MAAHLPPGEDTVMADWTIPRRPTAALCFIIHGCVTVPFGQTAIYDFRTPQQKDKRDQRTIPE